jgi:hypothetical protein
LFGFILFFSLFLTFFAFPLLSPFRSRWKKQGNHVFPNNKLVQEPEGNEENRYPDPDSKKMKIKYAKEPNEAHKNILKEEIL